jgi:hypothetical protein
MPRHNDRPCCGGQVSRAAFEAALAEILNRPECKEWEKQRCFDRAFIEAAKKPSPGIPTQAHIACGG